MEKKKETSYAKVLEGLRYKIIDDYEVLAILSKALKAIGGKIVVTIGTWDLLHIGHARYIREASEQGNILIVGVDTDRVVKLTKGPNRPRIPYDERTEMLTHLRYPDFVTPIDDVEMIDGRPQWQCGLLKAVRPDIFIAVEHDYSDPQLEDMRRWCGHIVVLPRQAETSTSAIIRKETIEDLEKKKPVRKKGVKRK